ncbi:type II toxin-antitoxin system Phd/YefM family antitoxin [Treponema ruminis]|uniref:Antitoxin n=1 Tax=Treponema ruminis TaxID=744515 RepID=A0A7W8LM38_9SPIR|nr:type II toxin-antitoxin system Phd/YefM family antitoxin [Treponema ruminis]MBB5226082.1 prevent-host-death family protein [Treponema ruminis]QSI03009.1 type II toxin-antitoxin system Phd/YefM family antitoxin [Treponema ruminis]
MNTVPIYEAKNKLPLFMHQAEESGPVFISRRNQTVGVLLSINEYNRLIAGRKKGNILDRAAEFRRKTAELLSDDDIDRIFDVRDHSTKGTSWEDDVFKGVFD